MLRSFVFTLPLLLVALSPAVSLAAGEDCPDGWFCEDNARPEPQPTRPEGSPIQPGPVGPPSGPGPAYAPPSYPPPAGAPDYGDERIILDAPDNPPARRRHRRHYREWGFNLHLEAALLGNKSERASDTSMAGVGFAFRYRPLPPLALEAGVDLLTGTDYQGYSRNEAALLLNALVFFNPHDVFQVYALAGLGVSGATVTIAPRSGEAPFQRHDEDYSYFGGQLGIGAEVRATRHIGIAADLLGFVRGRSDDLADSAPEFVDNRTHRATNTSGGGLLRVGVTFYW